MPMTYADATSEIERAIAAKPGEDAAISLEDQLLLANRLARLQRVVTDAGSGDRVFLRDLRGKRPELLSSRQRAHITRLAWRYRFQLPPGLRPFADPDATIKETGP